MMLQPGSNTRERTGRKVAMLLSNAYEPDVRVYREANSLARNGYAVTIFCWDREKKYPRRENADGIFIERCHTRGAYGKGTGSLLPFFFYYCFLTSRLLSERFDYVHCHDFDTLPAGLVLGRIRRSRVVYDAHEVEYFLTLPEGLRSLAKKMEAVLSEKTDSILVVNKIQVRQFAKRNFTYPAVREIRNCPEKGITGVTKKKKNGKVVLGYIGYIQPGTGVDRTVELFDRLCRRHKNLLLLLVGKVHPNFRRFEDLVAQSENREKIRMTGPVPYTELKIFYEQVDIAVILYDTSSLFRYNTPVKFYESMAYGIPQVITDIGDAGDLLRFSMSGFIVGYEDTEGIVERLEELIENPGLRHRMGENGRHFYTSECSWEIMEKRLLEAYQRAGKNSELLFRG